MSFVSGGHPLYRLVSLIVVCTLLLVSCNTPATGTTTISSVPSPTVTPETGRDVVPPTPTIDATLPPPRLASIAALADQTVYTHPRWQYSITVPASWRIVASGSGDVRFQTAQFRPSPQVDPNDVNEDEFFVGGVGVRGKIVALADDNAWISIQPNHSTIIAVQDITTPLGSGRLYTLERDRSRSTWKAGEGTWRAQYAYIPAGDLSYELWVQGSETEPGTPVPRLATLLNTFNAPNNVQLK